MLRFDRRCCVITLLLGTAPVWAQAKAKDRDSEISRTRSLWDPETMMQQACDGIARHYKLDAKQQDFTCKLLTERVSKFLDKHEKELWPLLMELTELQMAGKNPDPEAAKRISERGYHIFMEAKAEILRGQDDFRTVLNDEQKKIHDRDLKGLNLQFTSIDRRLQNWRQGNTKGRMPLDGVRVGRGEKIIPDDVTNYGSNRVPSESQWRQYVRHFVFKYRLDETQKTTAFAILKDLEDQAIRYRKAHRKDLADADAYVREAQLAKPFDKNSLEQAKRIRALLNKPFEDWFADLKSRLEQIPTQKQKAALAEHSSETRPPAAPADQSKKQEQKQSRPATSGQDDTPHDRKTAPSRDNS